MVLAVDRGGRPWWRLVTTVEASARGPEGAFIIHHVNPAYPPHRRDTSLTLSTPHSFWVKPLPCNYQQPLQHLAGPTYSQVPAAARNSCGRYLSAQSAADDSPHHNTTNISAITMDSMRSLNTSLPKTRRQPDVHQSFRTAALNVTNLYKSALADLDRARADGYQEALDELLAFLDRENIGMGGGEGWRIRQWANERFEGALPKQSGSDSDEDDLDDKRARSSSPVMEHSLIPEDAHTTAAVVEPAHRSDSAPPPVLMEATTTEADMAPPNHVFQFSAPQTYPSSNANSNDSAVNDFAAAARRAFPNPRRTSNRSSSRNLQRSVAQNLFQLGNGAGQKRRLMQDFFNVDGFNDRRDGSSGGPKRGRMT